MASKDRDAVHHGLNDLLGNVIRTDRERSGRGKGDAPVEMLSAPSTLEEELSVQEEDDTKTLKHYDSMTDETELIPPVVPVVSAKAVSSTKREAKVEAPVSPNPLPSRVEVAQKMSKSPTMTVTLRIPQAFNDWLDEYVHGSWPEKVRKQELVIEALMLLYARRGRPKEDKVPTELLEKEKD